MSEYPVQVSKVQAPPLREETLARDRLLEWLSVKVHRRVILLIAEAGYGKTTLLADFSRRTRLRILWFRLDGVVVGVTASCAPTGSHACSGSR